MKLRVLAFVDYYLPGFKGGGPAVSVSRLIENVSGQADCFVYTRDRDLGEAEPYAEVPANQWFDRDGVGYFYARPDSLGSKALLAAIRKVRPDVIYLNSFFSKFTRSALLLRLLGLTRGISFVVAPRGEFSPGALGLKSLKKKLYLRAVGAARLYKNVTWQVSSAHEMEHTKAVIDAAAHCFVKAPDMTSHKASVPSPGKAAGSVSFATLSRISPMKNLLASIEALREVRGDVRFTVYGPAEDAGYLAECEQAIASLPGNVAVEFGGPVAPDRVVDTLAPHHFLLFPTLGENFGHVIAEALTAGCPVVLSDRTPWLDLFERGCGWVLPLEDPSAWSAAVQECADMDAERYEQMRKSAHIYISQLSASSNGAKSGIDMFHEAISRQRSRAA